MTADAHRRILDAFDAVLDLAPDACETWLGTHFGDDTAAIDAVRSLLRADALAPSALPTELPGDGGFSTLVAPPRIGAYRLDSLIGAGGMGEVWLGVRDDGLFDQSVAIKLMRPSRFPGEALAFFDSERRALARLSHRFIARLFDGGVTENGLPWFVMELIDGAPLHVHAAARSGDVRGLIALMADIADAVQYAHSQLVVHGDLKPSNILITAGGEPRLIDFGIATLAAAAAEQGEGAVFPSTPAYASPQRLRGAAPAPADDIFALGLLLQGLLTGAWPQKPAEAPPSTGHADGDAVIAKACAADPEARYATAQAFAADLRAILSQRPTSLQQGDWRTEGRLFVRRHPRAVLAACAGGAALVAGLGLITLLYVQAEQARRLEQQRFNDVRALAGYMLSDFHDDLVKLPGSTSLRERNATVGWQYLTRLSEDDTAPVDIRRDIAVGYGRLGNAQATTSSNGTGKVRQGDWALQRSETILRDLVKHYPQRDDFKRELARTLSWRSGVVLGAHNDPKAARAALDESFALFDGVLARHPDDLEAAYGRWNAALGLGDLYFGQDNMPALKTLMEQTLTRFRATPAPAKYQSLHALLEAGTENSLGDASYYVTGPDAGVAHYRRAEAIMQAARDAGLMDMRLPLRQAYYDYQLSSSFSDMKQPRAALDWAGRGKAIIVDLGHFDDSAATLHTRDILSLQRALALSDLGRGREALAEAEGSVANRRAVLSRHPEDMDNRVNLAAGLHNLAKLYATAKMPAKACAVMTESLSVFAYVDAHGGVAEHYRRYDVAPEKDAVAGCRR